MSAGSAVAEERPCGVERTLVLLEADLPQFSVRDAALGLDKTSPALAIEAVTEYSRIFFDLFPAAYLCACVSAVKSENGEPAIQRLNLWAPQRQQSLQRIVERFGGVHFSTGKDKAAAEEGEVPENSSLFEASLKKVILLLNEGEEKRTSTLRTRLVCFSAQRSKSEEADIIKVAAEILRKQMSLVLCELVIVSLKTKAAAARRFNQVPKLVNASLSVVRHECLIDQLPSFVTLLAAEHFGLRQLRIADIPMKDTNKDGERLVNDVTILHPMAAHSPLAPDAFAPCPHDKPREQTLWWRAVDKKLSIHNLPCYCIHRVTPLLPFSSPAICLFRHIQVAGKAALLSSSDNPADASTHLLLINGGEVWLHCLQSTPKEVLPAGVLNAYSRRANEYRIENFASVIGSNTLYPPPAKKKNRSMLSSYFRTIPTAQLLAAGAIPPTPKTPALPLAQLEPAAMPYPTTKNLERTTRYYPLMETDTLLCAHEQSQSPALRLFLDPLRAAFVSETTDETQTAQAIEMLSKLQQYAVQNEPSLFPPLGSNAVARQEAYRRLWLELLLVARRSQRLMPLSNHGKIVSAMERLWPELSGLPPEPKEDEKEKEKDKMKIEPSVGAGIGADGELSRRAMQEMQMLRDREREREEEEKKQAAKMDLATSNNAAAQKSALGKRDRNDRTGPGRHKDLDTPQEETFYAPAALTPQTGKKEKDATGKNEKEGGGMKLALRRKKNLVSEQHARSVYGFYWNAVQQRQAPVRDFDGRTEES